MADILDYLDWRGDLSLTLAPFHEVDALILSELCYMDLGGIVPSAFSQEGLLLVSAAERYFSLHPHTDMGVIVPNTIPLLFQKLAAAPRFASAKLSGYVSLLDTKQEIQFSAVSIQLDDGSVFVAFRGTDDTIVGWKEDCNLAIFSTVPAQAEAKAYLQAAAQSFPAQSIRVGGHSKGGNLAVYAAVFCGEAIQDQILSVYNYDGPGFYTSLLDRPEHKRIAARIHTMVPESSAIGMLLEHEEDYTIVKSKGLGLFQHDGFSWEVCRDSFVHLPAKDAAGRMTEQTLRAFVREMPPEQRENFVDALFELLTCTDAQTLTELKQGGLKTASAMLKAFTKLDPDGRKALSDTLKLLLKTGAKSVQDELAQKETGKLRQLIEAAVQWLDELAEKALHKEKEKEKEEATE